MIRGIAALLGIAALALIAARTESADEPRIADRRAAPPAVVGHRGLAGHAPENTLANMRACLNLRVSIELDVRRAKDGTLVVIHDATLPRTTTGQGKVADRTQAELQALDAGSWFSPAFKGEPIPLLDDVFSLRAKFPAEAGLIAVDLKEADTEEDVLKLAARHGVVERLVFIGRSITEAEVRRRLRKAAPKAHVAMLATPDMLPAALADADADWIYLRHVPEREAVARIHAARKRVFLSGPKVAGLEPEAWKSAVGAGVDAILTDWPLELGKLVRGGSTAPR